MDREDYLELLEQGVKAWNAWRSSCPEVRPTLTRAYLIDSDLRGVDLRGVDLSEADLFHADMSHANLNGANLSGANFNSANLAGAKLAQSTLTAASLDGADLFETDFCHADLSETVLSRAKFNRADLSETKLDHAKFHETLLVNIDLTLARGLDQCVHLGPSIVDHCSLSRSKDVPEKFWRGCGLPDVLIDYRNSLTDEEFEVHSCFISCASKDVEFAERLHADLQDNGIRCWFAPEDDKLGDLPSKVIDHVNRCGGKLLLILSEASVTSSWASSEARVALEEEAGKSRQVLYPIRVDDAVVDTSERWAHDLRHLRHVDDFTQWKDHDVYRAKVERLLRELKQRR